MAKSISILTLTYVCLCPTPAHAGVKDLLKMLAQLCTRQSKVESPAPKDPIPAPLDIQSIRAQVEDFLTRAMHETLFEKDSAWKSAVLLLTNYQNHHDAHMALNLMSLIVERSKTNWVFKNQASSQSIWVGQNVLWPIRSFAQDRNPKARYWSAILLRHWAHIGEGRRSLAELQQDENWAIADIANASTPSVWTQPLSVAKHSDLSSILQKYPELEYEPGIIQFLSRMDSKSSVGGQVFYNIKGRFGAAAVQFDDQRAMIVDLHVNDSEALERLRRLIENAPLEREKRDVLLRSLPTRIEEVRTIRLLKRNRELFLLCVGQAII